MRTRARPSPRRAATASSRRRKPARVRPAMTKRHPSVARTSATRVGNRPTAFWPPSVPLRRCASASVLTTLLSQHDPAGLMRDRQPRGVRFLARLGDLRLPAPAAAAIVRARRSSSASTRPGDAAAPDRLRSGERPVRKPRGSHVGQRFQEVDVTDSDDVSGKGEDATEWVEPGERRNGEWWEDRQAGLQETRAQSPGARHGRRPRRTAGFVGVMGRPRPTTGTTVEDEQVDVGQLRPDGATCSSAAASSSRDVSDRVLRVLGIVARGQCRRGRHRTASPCSSCEDAMAALAQVDRTLGSGVAFPDHVVHVPPGRKCLPGDGAGADTPQPALSRARGAAATVEGRASVHSACRHRLRP